MYVSGYSYHWEWNLLNYMMNVKTFYSWWLLCHWNMIRCTINVKTTDGGNHSTKIVLSMWFCFWLGMSTTELSLCMCGNLNLFILFECGYYLWLRLWNIIYKCGYHNDGQLHELKILNDWLMHMFIIKSSLSCNVIIIRWGTNEKEVRFLHLWKWG